jgi:hypothetical protein
MTTTINSFMRLISEEKIINSYEKEMAMLNSHIEFVETDEQYEYELLLIEFKKDRRLEVSRKQQKMRKLDKREGDGDNSDDSDYEEPKRRNRVRKVKQVKQ